MKITSVTAWQIDLPLVEGRYNWSDGNSVEVFDNTVVEIGTDIGLFGYAETCPLGMAYLPSYPAGVRTGISVLAPYLIGVDPRELDNVNALMDRTMRGHPYVKAPIDVACWDLLGKFTDLPVCTLLGGRSQETVNLYRAISQEPPATMAKSVAGYRGQGYRRFQLKVGGDADEDIERIVAARRQLGTSDVLVADANTGWTRHEAARVAAAVSDLDVYIEQPCKRYEECLSIRRRTARPFVLDEIIDAPATLLRALSDDAMDVVNLKVSRVGGLTKAKLMRDICISSGVAVLVEDSWGSDIVTATTAHLAQSTPEEFTFAATDFNSYVTVSTAIGAPKRERGRISAPDRPGLGIEPNFEVLGKPVLRVGDV